MKANTAIILAGGKSRRMGFDKQLIKIEGKLIVDYLAEKLRNYFSEIILVTNSPELYKGKEYIFTKDIFSGFGPMAGIHAGLKDASSEGAYVIACDMPNINGEFVEYLKDSFEQGNFDGVISEYQDFLEPLNGIYGKNLIDELEKYLKEENLKLRRLIEANNFLRIPEEKLREFDKDLNMFKNINYKEDVEKI